MQVIQMMPIHAGLISMRFNKAETDLQFLIVENYEGKESKGFPAGKGNPGEDPKTTARREAKEETDLLFTRPLELILTDPGEENKIQFMAYFFTHWEKKSEPREPSVPPKERDKIKWVGWVEGEEFWKLRMKRRHEKARENLLEYLERKLAEFKDPRLWLAIQIAKTA